MKEKKKTNAGEKKEKFEILHVHNGLPTRYTDEQVAQALMDCHGIAAHAAKKLRLSPSGLYKYIRRSEFLQEALAEARQVANDEVESALFKDATTPGGNPVPKIFWLKARAGWIETTRHQNINVNVEPQTIKIGDKEITF